MTSEQACMENKRDKYYTKIMKTLPEYNDLKNAPLLNEKIQEAINKFMDEESDAQNVTVDTFSHKSNT